jgi:DNA invertase Pin-like site-specific DNA recombinase
VELVSITQTVSSDSTGEMFRKLLNVFDEHQSRENAKHVHRAMCENASQGFWNGSHPPYGYRTRVAERRGAKDKKVLVIDDEEAQVVREIFGHATGREGRPLGVKAIACRLTERGIAPVLDRQRLRNSHRTHLRWPTLLQPRGQSDRRGEAALAVGRDPGSGNHRRNDLQ